MNGDFSIVYIDKLNGFLVIIWDMFGKWSLLMNINEDNLVISSILKGIEIPAN